MLCLERRAAGSDAGRRQILDRRHAGDLGGIGGFAAEFDQPAIDPQDQLTIDVRVRDRVRTTGANWRVGRDAQIRAVDGECGLAGNDVDAAIECPPPLD